MGFVAMASNIVTFRNLIAANRRASFRLVVGFVLFVTALAMLLGVTFVSVHTGSVDWPEIRSGILTGSIAGIVAFLIALLSYFAGDSMILGISGCRPLGEAEDPELRNVVEEIAIAAGVPPPKIYMIEDSAMNAFATGRDPKHASVAITRGLRERLNRDELQGVMAHEMGHIRNLDIRLMLLLAMLIGVVVMLTDFFWRALRASSWSGGGSSRSSRGRSKDGAGLIIIILLVVAVVLSIIAPLLAQIIQLAVSRQREYLADATAVEFTRNPYGLANALRKLAGDREILETANRGTAHLYIVNPIMKYAARSGSMFASHPPIEDRIRRLEALTQ
jgi:heat shock protein HtpX